jgi:hypothetical protein
MWGLALILIPKEKYKSLFWYGLIWGCLVGHIFGWIFGLGLHCYEYQQGGPFMPFHTNFWLNFAWVPAIIIYLYYLPSSNLPYVYPLYLLTFSLASAGLDEIFHEAKLLIYYHWNPFFRFIIAVLWFWGAKVHYKATKDTFQKL